MRSNVTTRAKARKGRRNNVTKVRSTFKVSPYREGPSIRRKSIHGKSVSSTKVGRGDNSMIMNTLIRRIFRPSQN